MYIRRLLLGLGVLAAVAIAVAAVLWARPQPAAADAVSGNDDFANAWAIATLPFVGTQNTVGMTTETGEPLDPNSCITASAHIMGKTVWYSFTPASNQSLVADTIGSNYDTVLAVYTGSAVNALTAVACNDDISGGNLASRVNFAAVAGTTYYFQVGGYNGATGDLVFNLGLAPTPTPTATPCPTEKVPIGGGCGTPTPTFTPCPTGKVPFGGGCGTPTPTPVPPGFSIGIDLNGDTTDDCATTTGAPTSTCYLLPSSAFTLKVYLNSLGASPSYKGYDLNVTYSGVLSKDNASTSSWPQCAFPVQGYSTGVLQWGCAGASSTYLGRIGTSGFNCPATDTPGGQIALNHGAGLTDLLDKGGSPHFESEGSAETLTINCLFPTPTSTPTLTTTPKPSPTPKNTPTPHPGANGSLRIDADCEQPLGPPKDTSIQSQRYVLLGTTFHVCVYASSPSSSASGYQARVQWTEDTLDLIPRTGGQNDVWHLQPPLSGGPPNGAGTVQVLAPLDDGSGSDASVLLTTKDSAGQNSSPAYNGPVAQFEFVCQRHAAANIELTLPGDSSGSSFFAGVTAIKPSLKGATVICLEPSYDSDSDGCTNVSEAQTAPGSQMSGGLRNPLNPYDYFNPTHDRQNRVDDILAVVMQYFKDDSDGNPGMPPFAPGYNQATDRTLVGPNAWNLGPPDGQQRVDDILNMVKQYFHDCS